MLSQSQPVKRDSQEFAGEGKLPGGLLFPAFTEVREGGKRIT